MIAWKKILIISILLGMFILVGTLHLNLTKPTVAYDLISPLPPINETILEKKVNDYRVTLGLPPLANDPNLCQYATTRSTEIKTDWSHTSFNNNRCLGTGYFTCGENLSNGYYSEQATLDGWVSSPTHHENIKSDWTATCVKCSDNYCAQEFGK